MEEMMNLGRVVNATTHTISVFDADGTRIILELPTSEIVIRTGERTVMLSAAMVLGASIPISGIAITTLRATDQNGNPVPLPAQQRGVVYVVDFNVAAAAPTRGDFVLRGPSVRNRHGRFIGCQGLRVPHHPAAASDEPRAFQRQELVELIESFTGADSTWQERSPASLHDEAFELGLISREELTKARWLYAEEVWHQVEGNA
jgi:hypothetical protein